MLYAGDALKEVIVIEGPVYLLSYRVLGFCGNSFPFQIYVSISIYIVVPSLSFLFKLFQGLLR